VAVSHRRIVGIEENAGVRRTICPGKRHQRARRAGTAAPDVHLRARDEELGAALHGRIVNTEVLDTQEIGPVRCGAGDGELILGDAWRKGVISM
jgi:hypothetical protein